MVSPSSITARIVTTKLSNIAAAKDRNLKNTMTNFSIERLKILQKDLSQIVIGNFTKYRITML